MAERRKKGTRTGFTTGACSAAAARAATLGLVIGRVPNDIDCLLPNGQLVRFAVAEGQCQDGHAYAVVIKDAGDDPDVTDKAQLIADARLLPERPGVVSLTGGTGVGTVTLPGLGLAVGTAAINPVPRHNIEHNVRLAAGPLFERAGIKITISVPGGEQLAKRTLNGRLGIVGGISILGTSGIVHPYSTASFRASVVQGIEVAARQGCDTVVLTTGGRTEKFAMREVKDLPPVCFVQMGDFLKPALDTVVKMGIHRIIIGAMVGKLTKMAQGESITHAGRNPVHTELLADLAADVGVSRALCDAIRHAKTARFASEQMQELGLLGPFHRALAQRVIDTLSARYPGKFSLRVLVCDFDGRKIAEAPGLAAHA